MESILLKIQDPGWWLTILIAILIAVFGPSLRSVLIKALSALSENIRDVALRWQEKREIEIKKVAKDPTLYTISYVSATLNLISFFISSAFTITIFAIRELLRAHPDATFNDPSFWGFIKLVFLIVMIVTGYRSNVKCNFYWQVKSLYRANLERRDLIKE